MKTTIRLICICLAVASCTKIDPYIPESIVWNGVSDNESASFPFGNGTVAGNVWAENSGMYMYLTRNDCFSELGRLLKAGKIKLSVDSCIWDDGCRQVLDLGNGMVDITNSKLSLRIFADSGLPVVWIHGKLNSPAKVTIEPVIWRDTPHVLAANERESAWSLRDYKGEMPFPESADKVFKLDGCVGFFHHNDTSAYEFTLKNNHLGDIGVKDPINNRTFGAMMVSDSLVRCEDGYLQSQGPVTEFTVKIAVTSFPDCQIENWKAKTLATIGASGAYDKAEARTCAYWNGTWKRSYLEISTPDTVTGKKITELYNCQRWMTLCAGKSSYPIKFNGSIFTLSPKMVNPNTDFNPDYRRWGECFWWQNTRLPYFSMLKTGDWETIRCLGRFYHSLMPAFKKQAKVYYGAEGATIPETITQFGTFAASDYYIGTETVGAKNMCIRHIFQDPLELIHMLMDYYRYSGDEEYLREEIVPMSEEFLDFFISFAPKDSLGKMRIRNTQALETYWYGVENDMPSVAGLHAVVKDFSTLPSDTLISKALAEKIGYLREAIPDIPTEKDTLGNDMLAPAEKFERKTANVQNPELMAIFPFEVCNFTSGNVEVGRRAYDHRLFIHGHGWASDCQEAAILGMADEAEKELLKRIGNCHKAFRFPAYFGPNFDWVPDQDHGGNLMTAVQDMVLQAYDGKVYILPAFPEDWNVKFRFAVPGQASVWGEYADGKWICEPASDKKSTEIIIKP